MVISAATAFYIGSSEASKVYLGDELVWPVNMAEQYLTFEIVSSGTIGISSAGSPASVTVQYSLNKGVWDNLSSNESINVNAGDSIRWKGNNSAYSSDRDNYNHFTGTALFRTKGNIVSLIYGDDFIGKESYTLQDYALNCIFLDSSCIDAYDLYIHTKTGMRSLRHVFANCSLLTRPPKEIVGQDMGTYGLGAMFTTCTSLQFAPDLSNFIPTANTFQDMFYNCSSIRETPALYSGATPNSAYQNAFQRCTSLESAVLPSETLENRAYYRMFSGCTSLQYIEIAAVTGNTGSTTNSSFFEWVRGVPSGGIIVKKCELNLPSGNNGVPNGWTVVDDCPEYLYRLTKVNSYSDFSLNESYIILNETNETIVDTSLNTGRISIYSEAEKVVALPSNYMEFIYKGTTTLRINEYDYTVANIIVKNSNLQVYVSDPNAAGLNSLTYSNPGLERNQISLYEVNNSLYPIKLFNFSRLYSTLGGSVAGFPFTFDRLPSQGVGGIMQVYKFEKLIEE